MKVYTCTTTKGVKLYIKDSSIVAISVDSEQPNTNRLHLSGGKEVVVKEPVIDLWLQTMSENSPEKKSL